ncbi:MULTISPECIES: aldo/keto reductase [unclassified Variovorax]|jgi:diketogulonate reductase-like aldo/keto reductase|uniref:aldo/keto reductase n=1 Tax=unclassified Variovorax TaxID=663243 RepID=UPI0008C5DF3F|nr:Aldo/keto reductase [Variovorax sp. OK202]SFD31803.1 Aldo/keto reductase [Variovorax sp. OK212]
MTHGLLSAHLTRARFLRLLAALPAGAVLPSFAQQQPTQPRPKMTTTKMNTRPIPSTQEALPVIGCGTWIGFDQRPGTDEYRRLPGVLDALFAAGGTLIDSSPMYGRSEETTGELLAATHHPQQPPQPLPENRAFLATKVWTSGREAGIAQMEQSFTRLRTRRMDLMQVHNLLDWRTHLATLRGWKDQGRVRYIGITHYTASAYADVEAVLRAEKLDFLQINYSADAREAEQRLLPLAAERGVAVIVNMPFGGGGLLRRLRDKPLPAWAGEIGCTSWAQVLLKFVLAHPGVTCAIPGTGRAEHMADNAAAGAGTCGDAAFWRQHAAGIAS